MGTNLCGIYQLSQSNLHKSESESFSLVICTRKQVTPKKPQKYLLYKPREGRSEYLSSLYPSAGKGAENGFRFEVDGVHYNLDLDRDNKQATISPANSTNSINNVELGSKSDPKSALFGIFKTTQTGQNPAKSGSKSDPK